MAQQFENVSADLIWEIVHGNGAQLVRTRKAGGHSFSRDPYNLTNLHTRKQEGYVNDEGISIQAALPDSEQPNSLIFTKKTAGQANKPASSSTVSTFEAETGARQIYKTIVAETARQGYRPDLRQAAVARASAIKHSQKPTKEDKPKKLRGKAAQRAAAA